MISAARALVDSGFIVALIDQEDSWHRWAANLAPRLPGPWLTCEACVTESFYLLGRIAHEESLKVLEMLARGTLISQHLLPEQLEAVRAEAARYHSRAVDFADACLMVLSDGLPRLPIVTVDRGDFVVYLRGRGARKLLAPPDEIPGA